MTGKRFPASGKVSASDRAYFKKLARLNAAASRDERPAGTLREAFDRMERIERQRGIDVRAVAQHHWPDYDSHMAYLKAVKAMAERERKAGKKE